MSSLKHITYVRAFTAQHRETAAALRAVIERSQVHAQNQELESAALLVHRIHGTARMLGLSALGLFAGALERGIDRLRKKPEPIAAPEWQLLLAAADELGHALLELREHERERTAPSELLQALDALTQR